MVSDEGPLADDLADEEPADDLHGDQGVHGGLLKEGPKDSEVRQIISIAFLMFCWLDKLMRCEFKLIGLVYSKLI